MRSPILQSNCMMIVAVIGLVTAFAGPSHATLIRDFGLNETVNPSAGTTAVDSSGHANGTYGGSGAGPVVGVSSVNSSLYGTAAQFTQFSAATVSSFTGVNVGTGLNSLTQNFTVAAWIKPSSLSGPEAILSGANAGWEFGLQGNKPELLIWGYAQYLSSVTLTTGQWTHVAVTYDRTDNLTSFYVNGLAAGTAGTTASFIANTGNYDIGAADYGPIGGVEYYNHEFGGSIDEVRVYDTVLTQQQIAPLADLPEPSALAFTVTGLLGLRACAWRKRLTRNG